MADRERIGKVALRVVDGAAIDWSTELNTPGVEGSAEVMRNLQLVDSIARTLRAQPAEPADRERIQDLLESLRDFELPRDMAAMPLRWGKLEIRGRVGSGAFADVYRAFDPTLQREVALKLFRSADPALQRRLLEEGQRMARINHPGVVRIYGAEEHQGRVGLWMELVTGHTLDEPLGGGRRRGPGELATIGRELCAALAAVHQAGLVHGDIKAQNVLRDDRGRLLLTDFGSGSDRSAPDRAGRIRGTPLYLAPEILAGGPASARSDVYSLGVLLFFLASEEFPVTAESLPQLQSEHDANRRCSLIDLRPDLPSALVEAIEQAMDPDPARRFQTAGEFSRALGGPGSADTRPSTNRRRVLAGFGILMAAMAAAWLLSGPFTDLLRTPGAGYRLEMALYRFDATGMERLGPGATVRVGDRLALEFSASTDLYVYVFNEDRRGHAWGLFPLEANGAAKPLPGGVAHWLPGGPARESLRWQVDSVGGVERIHVVASPEPLADVARLYATLPAAHLSGTAGGFTARGIGSVSAANEPDPVSAAPLVQAAAKMAGAGRVNRGVHYAVIELRNPEP